MRKKRNTVVTTATRTFSWEIGAGVLCSCSKNGSRIAIDFTLGELQAIVLALDAALFGIETQKAMRSKPLEELRERVKVAVIEEQDLIEHELNEFLENFKKAKGLI